ncbi:MULTISPECIES: aminotransferase class IV family protein [Streptomyces]|uniref:aminotransferase class IV family protein n=1 Tax=Streptomyces TaxID=1883 RepID=UPI0004C8D87E|nr:MULTISPECIES: aminotransferase class IV family protein [Streptomyces]MDX2918929.1 aminotransferase class IV family protein [Streptomyces sp. NE06-03C]MDX3610999.1 aminotransferase class IV family protein [Streptomyces sp. FL06-04B]MDX3738930.1 aminotransferase class IV family protein [Streptomyces sp. ID01-15D]
MTTQPPPPHIEFDGLPATEETLRIPALYGFGHFTALQVRDGRVRGLGLHLARLDAANRELFALPLDGDRVRELVRHALARAGRRDASVRVNAYLPAGAARTTVMVTVREPAVMPSRARSLMSVPYARTAPHIKRPGEFGQTYYGVLAGRAGFDDALLTAPGGVVTEGAITNIGFWNGSSVVWPDAPALTGITMALLEQGLERTGRPSVRRPVTLDGPDGVGRFSAAFVCNSQGIAPVRRIDDTVFAVDEELMKELGAVYDSAPEDTV